MSPSFEHESIDHDRFDKTEVSERPRIERTDRSASHESVADEKTTSRSDFDFESVDKLLDRATGDREKALELKTGQEEFFSLNESDRYFLRDCPINLPTADDYAGLKEFAQGKENPSSLKSQLTDEVSGRVEEGIKDISKELAPSYLKPLLEGGFKAKTFVADPAEAIFDSLPKSYGLLFQSRTLGDSTSSGRQCEQLREARAALLIRDMETPKLGPNRKGVRLY